MAKKKKNTRKYLILPNGFRCEIIGEDGVYWYVTHEEFGETQFFKSLGWAVEEAEETASTEKEADGDV